MDYQRMQTANSDKFAALSDRKVGPSRARTTRRRKQTRRSKALRRKMICRVRRCKLQRKKRRPTPDSEGILNRSSWTSDGMVRARHAPARKTAAARQLRHQT